jgi:DNA-binding FadR family transcriptional regulator
MKQMDNRTESLIKTIQNEIISGSLKPGDKLLSLRKLAEKYDVSRSVVNSAVSTLSTKGYVRIVPRHYAVVNDFLSKGSLIVLQDIFNSDNQSLRKKMIQETLACRMLVEIDAVRRISGNQQVDLSTLYALIQNEDVWRKDSRRDYNKLLMMDVAFHNAIILLADNMAFALIYHTFDYLVLEMVGTFYSNPEVVDFVLDHHKAIYESLKNHDIESATLLMKDLLQHGETELLRRI